jgi:hypothetical protein
MAMTEINDAIHNWSNRFWRNFQAHLGHKNDQISVSINTSWVRRLFILDNSENLERKLIAE